MIPIGDENIARRLPIVTYLVLVINVVVFIYQLSLGPAVEPFILAWAARSDEVLALLGGRTELLVTVLVTSLTSMFIHGGWAHIVSNMVFLWVFGDNVEDNLGSLPYLLFYLMSGFGAVLVQSLLSGGSSVPMIGASGAISGVLAGYLLLYPRVAIRAVLPIPILFFFPFFVPAWLMIGLWFAGQLLNSVAALTTEAQMTGGVAYGAHVGGFVAGFLLALLFRRPTRPPRYTDYAQNMRYARRP